MSPRARATALAIGGVAISSLLIGGLTSPAQQYLPDELRSFANSAGSWTMFAFLFVWVSRARALVGALAGAVSFVLMVEAYGSISSWRGFGTGAPFSTSWTIVALVAGPVIGFAASMVRHGSRRWMLASVSLLTVLLIAEGIYGLTVIASSTSPVYWWIEITAGIAFLGLALLKTQQSLDHLRDFSM